ncbi:hypothetical protein RUM43_010233 [Polyplax serrata]|uniref:Uncharacterized protein n=1 Tax=Polyplax serrata TaxID=468196 RepID=A0AAN8PVJ3_POLSC
MEELRKNFPREKEPGFLWSEVNFINPGVSFPCLPSFLPEGFAAKKANFQWFLFFEKLFYDHFENKIEPEEGGEEERREGQIERMRKRDSGKRARKKLVFPAPSSG